MKLVLVVNQRARPPRKVHVFHILAGTVVSARAACGHVRPEGEVRTALPASKGVLGRYNFHPEGDSICASCQPDELFDIGTAPDFIRDPDDIKQLRW